MMLTHVTGTGYLNFVEIGIADYVCAINNITECGKFGTCATQGDGDRERNVKFSHNLRQKISDGKRESYKLQDNFRTDIT